MISDARLIGNIGNDSTLYTVEGKDVYGEQFLATSFEFEEDGMLIHSREETGRLDREDMTALRDLLTRALNENKESND